MRSVTVKELEAIVESKRGASFVTIIANTAPDFVGGKSSPMYGVRKTAKVNGMINWSYRNAVDNQRAREEQPLNANGEVEWFEPEPRKWGERLHDEVGRLLPTVEHKGNKYLELKVQKSIGYMYFRNNLRVPTEEVNAHLREKVEGRRQQVDNPVILRDYKLENIKAMRIDGELLVVQS
jgi:hypothetical protein